MLGWMVVLFSRRRRGPGAAVCLVGADRAAVTLTGADRSVATLAGTNLESSLMPGAIRETPALAWPAGQGQTVRLALTLRAGLTLADYGSLTLTVRRDPEWPRKGSPASDSALAALDPSAWSAALTAVGAADDAAQTPTAVFELVVPAAPGFRRYALDVVAGGGPAGRVQLVTPTWLTVTPSLL